MYFLILCHDFSNLSCTSFLCGFNKHLLPAVHLALWGECKQESYLYFFFFLKGAFFKLINLWLCWVFVASRGLSLVALSGGFSLRWLLLLRARALGALASVVVACRLSSCGSRAQLLCGMWDLPGPGLEPVSPAMAGRLPTTGPPEKPYLYFLLLEYL